MPTPLLILLLIILIVCAWCFLKRRQRSLWRASFLSKEQRAYLAKNFPLFIQIPKNLRTKLEGLIVHFMAEKKFYGGTITNQNDEPMVLTDDMKLLIAAQACLLVVNKPNRWFDELSTIIIYPASFKSRIQNRDDKIHSEHEQARSGESWMRGPVILAWDHSLDGARDSTDGHNVVIHEFAHQLDAQTGITDGAPLLDRDQQDREWARVFQEAFQRHLSATQKRQKTLIDPYGATNPAEFFSVCTETFFEQAHALMKAEPALYQQLAKYYKVDPEKWHK